MTWPATDGPRGTDVAQAWDTARATVTRLKHVLTTLNAMTPLDTQPLVSLVAALGNARARLAEVATVDMAALTAYARAQIKDQTFDAAVELPIIRAAVDVLFNWLVANVPQDASGYLLMVKFNGSGGLAWRTLTGAQETNIKAQITTLLAAID